LLRQNAGSRGAVEIKPKKHAAGGAGMVIPEPPAVCFRVLGGDI